MQLRRMFLTILLCLSGLAQATSYSYTYLENPNAGHGISSGTYTYTYGINNNGQIAGWFTTSSNEMHGIVYNINSGIYTSVDVPIAKYGTEVRGINDYGQMTGVFVNDVSPNVHSFLYDGSIFTTLDIPAAGDVGFLHGTQANDINNSGQIVGFYGDNSGLTHGFLYGGGSYTTLDVPNSKFTSATGINDNGIVVGFFYDNIGIHGFSYDGMNYTAIDNPSAFANSLPGTIISGINNKGIMTGYIVGQGETQYQNFIYDGSSFTMINVPNSSFSRIMGINDNGQIVGEYEIVGTRGGFLASPSISVPEPSKWSLMLLGLSIMFFVARNKPINV